MLKGRITFPVQPTEDRKKIEKAVSKFFPQEIASREDFSPFREAIFARRILDTTRSRLLANCVANTTRLLLHKQALLAGKISICDSEAESPLGAVRLDIENDDISSFIDWLAPKTADGVPVVE